MKDPDAVLESRDTKHRQTGAVHGRYALSADQRKSGFGEKTCTIYYSIV